MGRENFRLVDDTLGPLALDTPESRKALAELLAEFERSCAKPPPDYPAIALEKLFPERRPCRRH
jgi:hypothetical protein